MTHQQLVEEWKGKLQAYYRKYRNGHTQIAPERVEEFLEQAMLAAAKGAAAAGKVQPRAQKEWRGHNPELGMQSVQDNGFNIAMTQSEHQL